MKTIIVLLIGAFVAVTGTSLNATEEYLKEVTKAVLNVTMSLRNDIDLTLADIKTTNASSIPELIKKIPDIVSKNKAILDIEKTIKNTKAKEKKIKKCQKVFEKGIKELNSELQKRISKILKNQLDEAEDKLLKMKEDLMMIENALRNDLAKELIACQELGYPCMITDASLPDKDKYAGFVNDVKKVVDVLIGYITHVLDSKIVPSVSENIVLEPVSACLKKLSCK